MSELAKRIAGLAPERRQLLEQLLKDKGVAASPETAEPATVVELAQAGSVPESSASTTVVEQPGTDNGPLYWSATASTAEVKAMTRQFYNSVSRQLDATMFGKYAFFLNFGYVSDGGPEYSQVRLPDHSLNKNCVNLVLEVVGDCALTGCSVLDVGCGRGGTAYIINKFFDPKAIVGVDLSPGAIAFCKAAHRYPRISFHEGDAENLMFGDESFDVVTNVESSHSYPNVRAFYSGVFRVLKPGGYFLYTDLFSVLLLDGHIRFLRNLGFTIEVERDITNNVLLSCDETAQLHLSAFRQDNSLHVVNNFLGVPGSQVYNEMKTGKSTYRIYRLRKSVAR